LGELVQYYWQALPRIFPQIRLDEFVLMPNHLHGIILLSTGEAFAKITIQKEFIVEANASPQLAKGTKQASLGAMIQNFKSVSSRKANSRFFNPGNTLWQRNYFEHIIRNQSELSRIRDYIRANPLQWENDQEHPGRVSK
jgi:REP element-mobilizing transposase RayT